jgi:hypothetical protein
MWQLKEQMKGFPIESQKELRRIFTKEFLDSFSILSVGTAQYPQERIVTDFAGLPYIQQEPRYDGPIKIQFRIEHGNMSSVDFNGFIEKQIEEKTNNVPIN